MPSNLPIVSYTSKDAPERFTESLRSTGFGVITDHPISAELIAAMHDDWLAFFDRDTKQGYAFDPIKQDGFFSTAISETAKGNDKRDLKEFFHIFPHGRYPAEVSDAARRYYDQTVALAGTLLGWVEANTPSDVRARFSMPLPEMVAGSPKSLLRILRYPPLTGTEAPGALRAAAHEDINLLTVLPVSRETGLQLLTDTGAWMDIPHDPGALVINIGDMLQEASGSYFRSTTHRVINPTGESARRSRLSFPLFLQPRAEVILSARHTAGSYLAERLSELRGAKAV
jgi:isopenicillin N synthase-like dioxygenase